MKVRFDLKKKYYWLTPQILLILVSFEDHRCHTRPNQKHVCFWEGTFECLFDVFYVDLKAPEGQQCQWLKTIRLSDHDHKENKFEIVEIPDRIRPHIMTIGGGPGYASGYQQTHNLIFEMTFNPQT